MAADEVGQRGVEEEAYEGVAGVAQHQDERHQGALGACDGELAEVGPVDLCLLAGQGAQAQIRFGRPARAHRSDAVAEVVGSAGVATRLDHLEQPGGGERGEALQGLGDELHIGVELGRAAWALAGAFDAGGAQHPFDGGMVDAELAGDGACPPVLDEVVAQGLRLEFVVDCHGVRRSVPDGGTGAPAHRGTAPVKTHELTNRACTEGTLHRGGAGGVDIGGLACGLSTRWRGSGASCGGVAEP